MAEENKAQDLPIDSQIRSITNPLNVPFTHKWDGIPFTVEAGETKQFPGHIAVHLAKHLADYILINLGRFKDILRGDTLVAQAMTSRERGTVMRVLLDREANVNVPKITGEIKEVVNDFEGKAEANKPALIEDVVETPGPAQVEQPAEDVQEPVPVEEESVEEVEEEPTEPLTDEARFAELKEIGWVNLDKDTKKEYSELKKKLN